MPPTRIAARLLAVALVLFVVSDTVSLAQSEGRPRRHKQGSGPKIRLRDPAKQKKMEEAHALSGKGVAEGKPAPDFELKLLKAYDLEPGEDGEEVNTVKLSQYLDDKPVVLIFGSYT